VRDKAWYLTNWHGPLPPLSDLSVLRGQRQAQRCRAVRHGRLRRRCPCPAVPGLPLPLVRTPWPSLARARLPPAGRMRSARSSCPRSFSMRGPRRSSGRSRAMPRTSAVLTSNPTACCSAAYAATSSLRSRMRWANVRSTMSRGVEAGKAAASSASRRKRVSTSGRTFRWTVPSRFTCGSPFRVVVRPSGALLGKGTLQFADQGFELLFVLTELREIPGVHRLHHLRVDLGDLVCNPGHRCGSAVGRGGGRSTASA